MEKDKKFITPHITRIEIKGLWGKYDLELDLNDDVNVLIGDNGSFKTTFIELIYACLMEQHEREKYKFNNITIKFTNDCFFTTYYVDAPKEIVKKGFDAFYEKEIAKIKDQNIKSKPINVNQDYKDFYIDYTNLLDRENKYDVKDQILLDKISTFEFDLTNIDEQTIRAKKTISQLDNILKELEYNFSKYLAELTTKKNKIEKEFDERIEGLLMRNDSETSFKTLFNNYKNEKDKEIENIEIVKNKFIKLINKFYKGAVLENYNSIKFSKKELIINNENTLQVKLTNDEIIDIQKLSSGEKQLLIIFLKVLLQKEQPSILLMDEPEISLHLSWQTELINAIREINPNCQVIIATHAPGIFSKYFRPKLKNIKITAK